MKFKTTKNEILNGYKVVYKVPYCALQDILKYLDAVAYTTRREGWASDIYDIGCNVAISTGYAPFGKAVPREAIDKINKTVVPEWWRQYHTNEDITSTPEFYNIRAILEGYATKFVTVNREVTK